MQEFIVSIRRGRQLSVHADVDYDAIDNVISDIVIDSIHLLNEINLDSAEYNPSAAELSDIYAAIHDQLEAKSYA